MKTWQKLIGVGIATAFGIASLLSGTSGFVIGGIVFATCAAVVVILFCIPKE
jgi:uncharacterized membrane protein